MISNKHRILWVDCLGALIVGIMVLLICQPLSRWGGLPTTTVIGVGIANLVYGIYSLVVATRHPRPMFLVVMLAFANMTWLFVCVTIVVWNWQQITLFGILHVGGEGMYVAILGFTEWRWRRWLAIPSPPPK